MPTSTEQTIPERSRGIYLLPNMITLLALFAGFYAIIMTTRGRFEQASIAIFVAMLLDGLDGRIARLMNAQTKFGAELDSLSDMVSFGIAPAVITYSWSMTNLGKFGWLAAFLYAAAVALRLARFNTRKGLSKRYSQGLACTPAAGITAGIVWLGVDIGVFGPSINLLVAALTILTALVMVSNIPYRSFKDLHFKERVPFFTVVGVVLVLVLIVYDPPKVLFSGFFLYGASGPVLRAWMFLKKRRQRR